MALNDFGIEEQLVRELKRKKIEERDDILKLLITAPKEMVERITRSTGVECVP